MGCADFAAGRLREALAPEVPAMIADRILKRPMDALRREIRARLLENGTAEPRPDPLAQIGTVWSGSGADNMILIAGLARAARAKRYLEIGAYRGFTAGVVSLGSPENQVHANANWQRAA